MELNYGYGDVVLFEMGENGDWLGKSIAMLTGSNITHSGIIYKDNTILEMTDSGIAATPFHLGKDGYKVHILRLTPPVDYQPLLDTADIYLAKKIKYDFYDILLLGGLLVFKKMKPNTLLFHVIYETLCLACQVLDYCYQCITNQEENPSMICSQMVYQCYEDSGSAYKINIENGIFQESFDGGQNLYDYALLYPQTIDLIWDQPSEHIDNFYPKVLGLAKELLEIMEQEPSCPDSNQLQQSSEFKQILRKTTEFNKKLELLLKPLNPDRELPALFVTPVDLFHAENLEHYSTLSVLMDD